MRVYPSQEFSRALTHSFNYEKKVFKEKKQTNKKGKGKEKGKETGKERKRKRKKRIEGKLKEKRTLFLTL